MSSCNDAESDKWAELETSCSCRGAYLPAESGHLRRSLCDATIDIRRPGRDRKESDGSPTSLFCSGAVVPHQRGGGRGDGVGSLRIAATHQSRSSVPWVCTATRVCGGVVGCAFEISA